MRTQKFASVLALGSMIFSSALISSSAFAAKKPSATSLAVIKTTMGSITVKLFKDRAPKTVENFLGLASGKKEWTDPNTGKKMKNTSLYAGTLFHRIIPGFMIQGGDPLGTGTGGPGYKFDDEVHGDDHFDKEGILAMANAGKNADGSGTNGSQFFITLAPTPWLNGKHTIFGEVVEGMDVVKKIVSQDKDAGDRPTSPAPAKIESIKLK